MTLRDSNETQKKDLTMNHSETKRRRLALATLVKLLRATESVTGRICAHLAGSKLTQSQFGVLEALFHLGPLSQGEVGRKILKSSGNMTMVIDNLEKGGLVKRERKSDDRRVLTIHLTAKGKRLIANLFPRHAENIVNEMSVLTQAELKELGRLCKKLGGKKLGGL